MKMQSRERQVYINAKQQAFLSAPPKRKTFNGGRGSGKSTVKGFKDVQRMQQLPRSKFLLAGLTYNHILTKTIPSAEEAWRACGLKEYDRDKKAGHYVIGTKPPPQFLKPYQPPRAYDNVISFFNGYTLELLSMDRADSGRGGNYDGLDADESALLKEDDFNKVLMPMVRGNLFRYKSHLHQEVCDYTSAAWLPQGQWVYKTEELMKENPEEFFFIESTSMDNKHVLGPDYARKLKLIMSPLEYDVEVLNKRIKRLPNCFYPSFSEEKHLRPFTYDYRMNAHGILVPHLNDIVDSEPLLTSWDFNAQITSFITCQEVGREFRVLNAQFKKEQDTIGTTLIDSAVDLFIDTYKGHSCKQVYIYGDRNGNNKSPGQTKTFYEQIMDRLRLAGWTCYKMVEGLDSQHRLRHIVVNGIFSEQNARLPHIRMNQTNCKYLAISMQNSPMLPDFSKDKRSERLLLDQERATHLSDCLDNILMARYASLFHLNQGVDTVYFLH